MAPGTPANTADRAALVIGDRAGHRPSAGHRDGHGRGHLPQRPGRALAACLRPDGHPRFEDVDPADWRRVLRANVEGTYLTVQTMLPLLRRSEAGRIVFSSSNMAEEGRPGSGDEDGRLCGGASVGRGTARRRRHGARRHVCNQGWTVAGNVLGRSEVYDRMPYVFTDHYDLGMEYSGYAPTWNRVVVRGDLSAHELIAS